MLFKVQKIGKSHKKVNKCLKDHLANVIIENILFPLVKLGQIKNILEYTIDLCIKGLLIARISCPGI